MNRDIDDFSFYLGFAKPLVLNLTDAKDRTTAALWLKKLRGINAQNPNDTLHVEYLKLLLFVVQRNKLSGIFEKPPVEGPLESFPESKTALDMIALTKSMKTEQLSFPPVNTSISGDLCEFVAVQEVPNFGLHGYYAVSTDPLPKWTHPLSISPRTKTKRLPCFKDTCQLAKHDNVNGYHAERETSDSKSATDDVDVVEIQNPLTEELKLESRKKRVSREEENQDSMTREQTSRRDVPEIETRPCWGRNRYIERLIDVSPHVPADLDLSQADALLNLFKDRKMKPVKKGARGRCVLSSRRRQVERMMDLPPCARDPGDEELSTDEITDTYTCIPKSEESINVDCVNVCLENDEDDVSFRRSPLLDESFPGFSRTAPLRMKGTERKIKFDKTLSRDRLVPKRKPLPALHYDGYCEGKCERDPLLPEIVDWSSGGESEISEDPIDQAVVLEYFADNEEMRTDTTTLRNIGRPEGLRPQSAAMEDTRNSETPEPSFAILRKTRVRSREADTTQPEITDETFYWQEIIDHSRKSAPISEEFVDYEQRSDVDENLSLLSLETEYHAGTDLEIDGRSQEFKESSSHINKSIPESQESWELRQLLTDPCRRCSVSPRNVIPPNRRKQRANESNNDVHWSPRAHSTMINQQ